VIAAGRPVGRFSGLRECFFSSSVTCVCVTELTVLIAPTPMLDSVLRPLRGILYLVEVIKHNSCCALVIPGVHSESDGVLYAAFKVKVMCVGFWRLSCTLVYLGGAF